MPIYEYRCTECGHVFEVIAGFSANGTRKCEKCGATAKRLISAPQVVFHGNGFYVTDNKRPSKPAPSSDAEPKTNNEKADNASEKTGTK